MRAVFVIAALAMLASANAVDWDSCGTRYDRLKTTSLTFSASPRLQAGATGTIVAKGNADLHMPLTSGAWQIRVYEEGFAHPVYTTFGDLMSALKWGDAKKTTFTLTVDYTLPAKKATGNFTVSLQATDQTKSVYSCIELRYMYSATEPVVAVEEAPVPALKDGPHFWSCGGSGDILKNLQIKLDPPAPVKGKPVTISASGTVGESVSGGTVHYKAALDGIQLISKTDQLCDLLKKAGKACPVAAGPLSLGITVNIPSWAPGGNYSATATAVDQSSKELTCLQGWFVLS